MVHRDTLVQYINQYLNINQFKDYAPNGLQVQGKRRIQKVVLGVTASLELIDKAIDCHADAILVHHGWFWRGEAAPIVGMKYRRIARLMRGQLNLLAYHLPLDVHPEVGNNIRLARLLSLTVEKVVADGLLYIGSLPQSLSAQTFATMVTERLQREPLLLGNPQKRVKRIAWCTGAAQDYLTLCAQENVDAYVSGEVSERTYYEAVEQDLVYLAAGHSATERYGIQALGKHLQQQFPRLEIIFMADKNPV